MNCAAIEQWLNRGFGIDKEIDGLIKERQRAFDRACSITTKLHGDRSGSATGNIREDWTAEYIEYTETINNRTDDLWQVKGEIMNAINAVADPRLRQLLLSRFIYYRTYEAIAEELNLSVRQVHRLKKSALKRAGDFIPKRK